VIKVLYYNLRNSALDFLKLGQIIYLKKTGFLPASPKTAVKYWPGRLNTGHLATLLRA